MIVSRSRLTWKKRGGGRCGELRYKALTEVVIFVILCHRELEGSGGQYESHLEKGKKNDKRTHK